MYVKVYKTLNNKTYISSCIKNKRKELMSVCFYGFDDKPLEM